MAVADHVFAKALSYTVFKAPAPSAPLWLLEGFYENEISLPALNERLEKILTLLDLKCEDAVFSQWQIMPIDASENWLEKSYQGFQPFSVGPFFIFGSHFSGGKPQDKIPLQIDAATAFGSGEHGTTKGCLLALSHLKEEGILPDKILDMGTGSGILALAAYKLWGAPTIGIDNDPECVIVSERHASFNDIAASNSKVEFACGDGFKASLCQNKRPFDLVIANILAGPLKDMAADLERCLSEKGIAILSGILNEQADDVLKAYEKCGLALKDRIIISEWTTILLTR